MLKLYSFLIVALFGLTACSESDENRVIEKPTSRTVHMQSIAGLSWYSHIDNALESAQKSHKNLIVMVGEASCRWCKKMKERTLTDEKVKEKMSEYILVSVKRSDKAEVAHVPEFDGSIPSFFFMKDNEEVYDSVIGYFKADDFLRYMNEIEE